MAQPFGSLGYRFAREDLRNQPNAAPIADKYFFGSTATTPYASAVVADSPWGYWKLKESSGTTATDLGSGANNGTYTNGHGGQLQGQAALNADTGAASYSPNEPSGQSGNYVGTSGTPNNYSTCSSATGLTYECLFKPASSDLSAAYDQSNLITQGSGSSGGWNFRIQGSATSGQGYLYAYAPSGYNLASPDNGTITPGNVYHLALTWDGTTVTLYINGVAAASGNPGYAVGLFGSSGQETFFIGQASATGSGFGGLISDCAVYPAALSATRIAAHYAAVSGGGSSPTYTASVKNEQIAAATLQPAIFAKVAAHQTATGKIAPNLTVNATNKQIASVSVKPSIAAKATAKNVLSSTLAPTFKAAAAVHQSMSSAVSAVFAVSMLAANKLVAKASVVPIISAKTINKQSLLAKIVPSIVAKATSRDVLIASIKPAIKVAASVKQSVSSTFVPVYLITMVAANKLVAKASIVLGLKASALHHQSVKASIVPTITAKVQNSVGVASRVILGIISRVANYLGLRSSVYVPQEIIVPMNLQTSLTLETPIAAQVSVPLSLQAVYKVNMEIL